MDMCAFVYVYVEKNKNNQIRESQPVELLVVLTYQVVMCSFVFCIIFRNIMSLILHLFLLPIVLTS